VTFGCGLPQQLHRHPRLRLELRRRRRRRGRITIVTDAAAELKCLAATSTLRVLFPDIYATVITAFACQPA
jgi:hypothetical protein